MNILKDITSGEEAKKALIDGVNKVADVVTSTMGYRGRTVLIEEHGGLIDSTKDGFTVLESIHLEDPLENAACQILKEASQKTVDIAGDNTTLTILLAQMFIKYAHEKLAQGTPAIDIKNDIERSKELIIKEIEKMSIETTDKLIYDVAKTSANSDEFIAKVVADAFIKAGENGSVAHFRSDTEETYLDHIPGTLLESGYVDELYQNVSSDRTAVLDTFPLVLISNINFRTVKQIEPFLSYAAENQRELLIISEMEFQVQNVILQNKLKGALKVAVVTPPAFGGKRKDLLNDLAILCGTQAVTTLSGDDFSGRAEDFLGVAEKVVVGKSDTIITPAMEKTIDAVQGKISELKEIIENTNSNMEKKYLRDRISKLSGGVSIIKVGGYTESELKERMARVEDAVCAVRSAKEEGVVAGGGTALLECSKVLFDDLDDVSGISLRTPFLKILSNASIKLEGTPKYPIGYDVKEFKEINMFDAGIVDSAKAIKTALTNAISVAGTILMTDNVITLKREKYEPRN